MKISVKDIHAKKAKGEKVVVLTAYDYPTAKIVDESGVDIILVGDSVGMVLLGYEETKQVSMPEMLHHTAAVSKAAKRSLVVADMPYGSYESDKTAVNNALLFVREAGADAVKLEGGTFLREQVEALVKAGVPVMGHVGMLPQFSDLLGGYRVQGKDEESAEKILKDAMLLDQLGAFAIVIECVPSALAKQITQSVQCPTIGIGAGPETDGQVMVLHDMLGFKGKVQPKFVRQYADIETQIQSAVNLYKEDVLNNRYPNENETY